ncbi:MAG: uridine diphosphate-N-acetylglucosamine-binding protein YvcK [Streptosporangiales bacterium]|nr:uridine diphosphate-N-acetylglucosamine-binding protein YvcK [Streptosporangiales bacterium]
MTGKAGPRVVALGGGHGLYASLSALRRVTRNLTAVVTVADDGGSSGRLRKEFGVLPPGDLRMALAALCRTDEWGETWREVVQHRFVSDGPLNGHAVGNLLIVSLAQQMGEPVAALDWVGRLLGAQGRVLPMCPQPLGIRATVRERDGGGQVRTRTVDGQVAVATTSGEVQSVQIVPDDPPACPESLAAIEAADWVVLGPGSWFTSVLPHLKVPELAAALLNTSARKVVALNLAPQPGETAGFSPEQHLRVLAEHAPTLQVDVVVADERVTADPDALVEATKELHAELVLERVGMVDGSPRHDPRRLAGVYRALFAEYDTAGGDSAVGSRGQD